MIDVAYLNRTMCEFAIARCDAMGESAGGLKNYYAVLARAGRMLRPEEVAIAEYIDRTTARRSILELCAGAAQLGHLLSLRGHSVDAVEIDRHRRDFAVELGAHVGSCCRVGLGDWRDLRLAEWQLVVTINAVSAHTTPADARRLVKYARGGGEFIIRPRQFGSGIAVEIPGLVATQVFEDVYHYAA